MLAVLALAVTSAPQALKVLVSACNVALLGIKGRHVRALLPFRVSTLRLFSLSNTPTRRPVRLLLLSHSDIRPVSWSNMPAGKVVRLLLCRKRWSKLVRSSNTSDGKALRLLSSRFRVTSVVSPSKMSPGRLARLLCPKSRVRRALSPSKSPDFRPVREALFVTSRLVICPRSVAVTAPQVVLWDNASTMASRTFPVRLQTSDGVTASVCGDSAPSPLAFTARSLKRYAVPLVRPVTVYVVRLALSGIWVQTTSKDLLPSFLMYS